MLNRTFLDDETIQFEDYAACARGNRIGEHIEVLMAGHWSSKRFVITNSDRHPVDHAKLVLRAKGILTRAGRELDPVAGTVRHRGAVVARYVRDDASGLHYVGAALGTPDAPSYCGETAADALEKYVSGAANTH